MATGKSLLRLPGIDLSRTACFTGHRPEGFPFELYSPKNYAAFKKVLQKHVYDAVGDGYDTFITGMQRGTDIIAGLTVLEMKKTVPGLRLYCVSPFESEITSRHGRDLYEYITLRDSCDYFTALRKYYSNSSFHERNRVMVNNSTRVIAAVYSMGSGTGNTLRYAESRGTSIDVINLEALGGWLYAH